MGLSTRWLSQVGVLSALSIILMFLSFPLPFLPGFLKLDLAELPALIGLFTLGPWGAVAIEGVKNLIHLTGTRTFAVGELANFLIGTALIMGTYGGTKLGWGLRSSLATGVIVMTVCAGLVNLFILIPLYALVLGIPEEALVKIGQTTNPKIVDLTSLILWGIVPFNLIKGSLIGVAALAVLPRLKRGSHSSIGEK